MNDVKSLTTEVRLMIEVLQTENAALQAENKRLREALAWYADKDNYRKYYSHDDDNDPLDTTSNVQDDAGETARKALGGE